MQSITPPVRQVPTEFHEGKFKAKSILSPEGFPVRALIKVYPRRVIPLVFLPGIMGSNLRLKENGAAAWRPPNGKADGIVELVRYLNKDAGARQRVLHPALVEVDEDGPLAVDSRVEAQLLGANRADLDRYAELHGWGELHQESYAFILNTLHDKLHNILDDDGRPSPYWSKFVLKAQGKKEFGAEKEFKNLSADDLKKFSSAAYPVHAVGYNWLQSNHLSANRVAERVEAIIRFYRDTLGKDCHKVILVTHSMGGLVGRAFTNLLNSQSVLAVVHGVMPAIGAPATYKRMRAGFEGVAQVLLGRNGAETTAVLSQSPGPLELLPTSEYSARADGQKRHWLRAQFRSPLNAKYNTESVLGAGDPYEKIYLNQANWWRLVHNSLLRPDGGSQTRSTVRSQNDAFRAFARNLETAREFHQQLAGKYHSNSHAFYAADPDQPSWGEVRWNASGQFDNLTDAEFVSDNLNGLVLVKSKAGISSLLIADPDVPGDGTVPEASGQAPREFVKQIFRHEGKKAGHPSYEHQFAYGQDFVAGLTLYSVARLTLDAGILDGR